MSRYETAPPPSALAKQDEGIRDLLAQTDRLVDALGDHLGAIDARLFGERPSEVARGEPQDAAVPPVQRSVEALNRELSMMCEQASSIRNRL
jgi:hypothetical protein